MARISSDGWTSLVGPEGTEAVHVRVDRDAEGRLTITDLYVHGEAITNQSLRSISIPRLEARLRSTGQYLERSAADGEEELTVPELRKRRPSRQRAAAARQPLRRPEGDDPDAFYQLVAIAYSEFAAASRAPSKAIAAEADVPITTAHRWVREARRRGHLPPATHGRAG